MFYTFLVLGIIFITSFLSILCIIAFTRRFGFFDPIDERKVHTGNIPRLGGVGILIGFVLGLILFYFFKNSQFKMHTTIWTLITGCTMIFIMGVWDDMKPWRARYKLMVQCSAALLIMVGGYSFSRITFGSLEIIGNLGIWKYPLTFVWIIGVTNAINFIDGIDGLAGSISFMIALTYSYFFYSTGNEAAFFICLVLAISILGFLFLNLPLPKAKIFMGDGGSQFLGFALAVLPLMSKTNGKATIGLPLAGALLLIPIYDTFAAIWRRLREKRSIDSPDKLHLHHKLMGMGFSSRQVLIIIITLQLTISLLVSCSFWIGGLISSILLFTVYLLCTLFFYIIHLRKNVILAEGNGEV